MWEMKERTGGRRQPGGAPAPGKDEVDAAEWVRTRLALPVDALQRMFTPSGHALPGAK